MLKLILLLLDSLPFSLVDTLQNIQCLIAPRVLRLELAQFGELRGNALLGSSIVLLPILFTLLLWLGSLNHSSGSSNKFIRALRLLINRSSNWLLGLGYATTLVLLLSSIGIVGAHNIHVGSSNSLFDCIVYILMRLSSRTDALITFLDLQQHTRSAASLALLEHEIQMLGSFLQHICVPISLNLVIILIICLDAFLDISQAITLFCQIVVRLLRLIRISLSAEWTDDLLLSGVHYWF